MKRIKLHNNRHVYVYQTADTSWRYCTADGNRGPFKKLSHLREYLNDWCGNYPQMTGEAYCEDVDHAKFPEKRGQS